MPFFFQRIIAHNNAHYNLMRLVLLIEMLLGAFGALQRVQFHQSMALPAKNANVRQ